MLHPHGDHHAHDMAARGTTWLIGVGVSAAVTGCVCLWLCVYHCFLSEVRNGPKREAVSQRAAHQMEMGSIERCKLTLSLTVKTTISESCRVNMVDARAFLFDALRSTQSQGS